MPKRHRPALVALTAVAVTAGLGASTASSASTVRLKDNFFTPKTTSVSKGSTVTFRWAGKAAHNVVVERGPVKFRSSTKVKGTYKRKLTRRGSYTIVCTLHPGMTLKLRVR